MLIFDNLIYRWQHSGGISTVWYELTKRVVDNCQNYLFLEYLNSPSFNYLRGIEKIPSDRIKILSDRFFELKRYLPVKVDVKMPFVFHSSYYRTCTNENAKKIITLHDFTYEYYRQGISKWIHCHTKHMALKDADVIVCISENTKRDLFKFVPGIDKRKVRVIYNGVSSSYFPLERNTENFLLFVGDRSGYKNFKFAVECASKAKMSLVICGKKLDEKEKEYLNSLIPGRYVEKGFVSVSELNELYNIAFALIYPSSYEGFGIPVLEAQKAGCPVLALDNSSIPEVIGDVNMLCSNLDISEFQEKIRSLRDKRIRKEVIKNGILKSSKFSWDKTFKEYFSLYKELESQL